MKHLTVITTLVFAALALSGCASQPKGGIEVTRFHLNEAIPPQEIAIEPADGTDDTRIEYTLYAEAVKKQLVKLGMTPVESMSTPLIATVGISRQIEQTPAKRSKFSVGLGMGSFGSSGGVSGGVNMPVGGTPAGEALVNKLDVRIIRREENAVSWEGEALVSSDTSGEASTVSVDELAAALFNNFPGESGKTVTLIPENDAAE